MSPDIVLTGVSGAVAQFVDGLLGMGYGVSASTLLMAFGVAPAVISATVHAAELPTAAVSGLAHLRAGNVDRTITLPLAAGGVVGAIIGASVLVNFAAAGVKPFVALVLFALGVRMIVVGIRGRSTSQNSVRLTPRRLAALGLLGGALDAFGGGGWGPTCTSVLLSTDGRTPARLIGSVNAAEVATTAAAVATFAFTLGAEPFAWTSALPLLLGGMLVAPLAAKVCSRVDAKTMAIAVGVTLVALNASILAGAVGFDQVRPILWSFSAIAALAVVIIALRARPAIAVESE